jgi:hypothetical protein
MIKVELPGLFERPWCDRTAAWLDARGFTRADRDYPTSYRTNERWVADEPELAREVLERLAPHLPPEMVDASGARWRLAGLDERMRACRYLEGQWFGVHRDGVHWRNARERSFLSVLVYLDDGFEGGHTRFFADRSASEVTGVIVPAIGKAAFFDHLLWHDGAPVERGIKHVLRTDVMYRRDEGAADGHLGYVWALAASGTLLFSGGRDRTIRAWRDGVCVSVTERAHEASVTCLAAEGDILVSGSRDRSVARWRIEGDRLARIERVDAHDGAVLAVAIERGTALSAGADGKIVVHGRTSIAAHEGWAWGVVALEDDRWASVGDDRRLVVGSDRVLAERTFDAPLRAVCRMGEGRLAVGALDGSLTIVRLGDLGTERVIAAHAGAVTCVAEVPGVGLTSGGEDDHARVWQGDRAILERRHGDFVRAVCARGATLASAGYDGVVREGPIVFP